MNNKPKCVDCGKQLSKKHLIRCFKCYLVYCKKDDIFCCDCGVKLTNRRAKRCHSCSTKNLWTNKTLIAYGNRRKEKYEASFNNIYVHFKLSAKRRNHEIGLTKEEFKILSLQKCSYCGDEPNQYFPYHDKVFNGTFKYNGLDRIDSNKGYTKDNITTCCKYCNWAKNSQTKDEFLNHIKKIYEHNNK
jgi:hypothetical protein